MISESAARPAKRIKLEDSSPPDINFEETDAAEAEGGEDHCTICLQPIVDRTVMPLCSHEFCFECLMVWSGMFRPLVSQMNITYVAQSNPAGARYALEISETT